MKVAVGVACSESSRYSIFWDSLMHVRGVTTENVLVHASSTISRNRNRIAERAIAEGYDAVWYVDDDQVFSPPTLEKLIAHDKDIVSGLYLMRQVPFSAQAYEREDVHGNVYPYILKDGQRGLVKTVCVGAGCMLVKTKVFKEMVKPWWRLGQISKEEWSDDVDFCRRARAAGFDVWCDLGLPVGHQMSLTVWPCYQDDGTWTTIAVNGREIIAVWPSAKAPPPDTPGVAPTVSPFLVPKSLVKPGERAHFYQDIHGFMDYEDVYRSAVQNAPAEATFVEIGSWMGRSAAFMAVEIINSGKKIELHCVDSWKGSEETPVVHNFLANNDGRALFEANMRKGGVLDRVKVHHKDSVKAAADFADGSVDFCFVDGAHNFEAVVADIKAWLPKVKSGGVLAGHDYNEGFVDVKNAVDACFEKVHIAGNCWLHIVK